MNKTGTLRRCGLVTLSALAMMLAGRASAAVDYARDGGPTEFGAAELEAALRGRTPQTHIVLTVARGGAPESFRVRVSGESAAREIRIEGADAAGVMYGAMDVAETIRLGGPAAVQNLEKSPHLRVRGMKLNAPLDARTPSYSDPSDAAQKNIATMWDASFWKELIDRLAKDRYNLITLWSLHPFPSLVKVPEYPDVALADVQRSKVAWKELYTLQAMGLDTPEILGNTETLRRMTIDEKIAFWREVLRYGKSRNVNFAIVTWNVFTNGIDPARGLPATMTSDATADYFRRSVAALLRTYPDLAGVGVTAGENMVGATAPEKEAWLAKTYGQGVLDVLAEQPERRVLFFHRQHEAGAAEIARHFGPLLDHPRVDFVYSFKYAEAHALAVARPRFHENYLKDLGGRDTMWTLRNDDVYYFRWHAPDFVRDFVRGLPVGPTRGFYYGSDGHVWGRDFLDANRPDDAPRPLELEKHAWHWRLWGRLGYEPELDNTRLTALLQERFPTADARVLFTAWQDASLVPTTVTSFHWGPLDFHWYVEACQGRPEQGQTPTGFHDVNRFISLRPHPASGMVSIPDYVKNPGAPGTTPPQVAAR
ncbi:MAG: carbohydrate-binding family 6 protein, partial [Verrucomicrobia bacterium]|nr:carbohydrate-binding family 6 protein [Verrucomicrobiota bacterium]